MLQNIMAARPQLQLEHDIDPYWDNVGLYVPCVGPDEGQLFRDASKYHHDVPIRSASQTKTDNAVLFDGLPNCLCDGANDELIIPDHSVFDVASSDWTLDADIYLAGTTEMAIYSQWGATNDKAISFTCKTNQLKVYWTTNGTTNQSVSVAPSLSQNARYHYRCSKSGSSVYFGIDGTQIGSTQTLSGTIYNSSGSVCLGAILISGTGDWNGRFAHVRFTVGVARSTGNYTVPQRPYPTRGR